ncbi:MAG: alpha-mannosidase [Ruminococcaceae bacterium]|nr:alpha-mannosidase [Oscillospiraceae bacterium]
MKKMHLIGNSHLDPIWLWQWQEGFAEIKATYRAALDRMKDFPDFTFAAACGSYYAWIEQSDPAMFEEIRARVAEGRWCLVGGWWLQPDCNLPAGESFARHALLTQRYFKEKFGTTAETGYNVDSFGHNGNLPMILRHGGLKNYVFMRPMPHEKTLPDDLFRWRSADGSEVTTWRIKEYYNIGSAGNFFDDPIEVFHRVEENCTGDGMAFYGVGNHGGGVTIDLLNKMHEHLGENYVYSDPDRFFAENAGREMPLVEDDLQFHAKGCYAACSDVKRGNRVSENALLAAEKLSVLSREVIGTAYPAAEMDRAWKNVLFNQFHDILGGCSIKEAYDDAAVFYGESQAIAARQANFAAQQIAWNIDTTGDFPYQGALSWVEAERIGTPIVVFNPHAHAVKMPVHLRKLPQEVTDECGNVLPIQKVRDSKTDGKEEKGRTGVIFQADVPALGWRMYRMRVECAEHTYENPFTITEHGMDNGLVRVSFDPATGELATLFDLKNNRAIITASKTHLFDDTPYDTWAHGMNAYETELPCDVSGTVKCIEEGPIRATFRVTQTFGASTLVRDYTLFAGSDTVQVKVKADYREPLRVLKFGYTAAGEAAPRCQIPFGSIARSNDGAEHACVGWFRVGDMALTTDSKYSFSVHDKELQLTALRGTAYADHFGERDEYYEYMDQGDQRFTYLLFPFATEADAARRTDELCQPLAAVIDTFHRGSLPTAFGGIELSKENVVVTAVKPAEDGEGVVLRLNEVEGRNTVVKVRLFDDTFEIAVPHHGVKTLLIKDGKAIETDFMEWGK